ncbi:hypothetical protein V3C99_009511 [Haemonchus contortus]
MVLLALRPGHYDGAVLSSQDMVVPWETWCCLP